jgi:hypothetical protein
MLKAEVLLEVPLFQNRRFERAKIGWNRALAAPVTTEVARLNIVAPAIYKEGLAILVKLAFFIQPHIDSCCERLQ